MVPNVDVFVAALTAFVGERREVGQGWIDELAVLDGHPDGVASLRIGKERDEAASGEAKEEKIVKELLATGVPKTHIQEYIGRYDSL